jgi:hypothetical protein
VNLLTDPVQRYVFQKEILNEAPPVELLHQSKWYAELAGEQRANGSWGRFHTQDTKAPKQKHLTTETALRRARELCVPNDDPVITKAVALMERYISGDEPYPDSVEKHNDNGKSFLIAIPHLVTANLNLHEPLNPYIKPYRDNFIAVLKKSVEGGHFSEEIWERENREYRGPCLGGCNVYPLMILRGYNEIEPEYMRTYLRYLWNREEGIYYAFNGRLSGRRSLEDRDFLVWVYTLEYLAGFPLFKEIADDGTLEHLHSETLRLIDGPAEAPKGGVRFAVRR